MGKIVFLVLAAVALLWWFSGRRKARPGAPRAAATPPAAEAMVRCAHCGLHLPHGEALFDADRPYCSETHRRAGPQAGGPR